MKALICAPSPSRIAMHRLITISRILAARCVSQAHEGDSPATDKESEDDDGNRWWSRSRDSRMLLAPFFYELEAFINWITLKKADHKTRKKRERKTETTHRICQSRMIFRTSSSASFSDLIVSLHSSTPGAYRLRPSSTPTSLRRHDNIIIRPRRWRTR
jgi:hypothetical protein